MAASVAGPLLASRALWLGIAVAVVVFETRGLQPASGVRSTLVHWDAIAYLDIARDGYPAHLAYQDAFLPGYPLLVHVVAFAVRDTLLSAWLVNVAAEAVALWYIARLVQRERDSAASTFAVWAVALAPTAVFLTAPFTESPFIAAAAASLYYSRAGRQGPAALAAAVATGVRLTGLALLPALALEILLQRRRRAGSALRWLLLVPLPLLAYCAYMQVHTGHALAFLDAERLPSFGQTPAAPWDGFGATWQTLTNATDGEVRSIFAREVAFGLLGLVLCAAMWASTRIPRSFALYCSIAWLMTASLSFWRSEARYLLALFPAVILVADLTSRIRGARTALVAASVLLMCAGTWVFAQGRWLG